MPHAGTVGVDSIWAWAGLGRMGDTGHNIEPAAFAPDEETWDKAKKAASKSYAQDDDAFWPSVVTIYKNMGGKIASKKEDDPEQSDPSLGEMPSVEPEGLKPDDRAIIDLMNDNPGMNVSTFYNLLKSKGFQIIAPEHEQKEADAAGAFPQVVRSKTKESAQPLREKGNIADGFCGFKFLEGVKSDSLTGPTKFRVALIQEGLGNLKDAFYYTREALESAVPIFEGKKYYVDHPDALEEKTRPERSVRDIVGHFENLHVLESDDGRAMLCADLCMLKDDPYRWARSLMTHAVEFSEKYPDKDFIGLSINASGDANPIGIKDYLESGSVPKGSVAKLQKAMSEGLENIKLVTAIKDAVSCDMVTEAGASGRILEMLEREKMPMKKKETKVDPEKGFEKKQAAPSEPEHADEQQDIELIKKMIAKHMGDEGMPKAEEKKEGEAEAFPPKADDEKDGHGEPDADDEAMKHAMQAYEYYAKERKMEGEEAAKHAAEAVKCAMHMAKKHEAMKHAEAKKEDEGMKHAESEGEEKKHESDEKKEGHEKKKESEVARLAGRVAFLESELNKVKVTEEIEKRLGASKLPRSVTKSFRESIGEVKSLNEFERLFGVFEKAYRAGGEAGHAPLDLSIEKTSRLTESTRSGETTVGFADCVK